MKTKRLMFVAFAVGIVPLIGSASPPPRLADSDRGELNLNERAHGKRAWEWTPEERVARRFDPSMQAARRAVAVGEGRISRDDPDYEGDVVLGSRDPELLMPWELIDGLLTGYVLPPPKRDEQRETWSARGACDFLVPDCLARVQEVVGPFIDANRELRELLASLESANEAEAASIRERLNTVTDSICPLRAQALSRAREVFGRERFDRFLYEVVAPDMDVQTSSSSPSTLAYDWLGIAGGCQ